MKIEGFLSNTKNRARLVVACLLLFILSSAMAMLAYPGGTWWEPARRSHSFWDNFFCDLLHNPSLNHQSNTIGSRLAAGAMLVFIAGLSVFWSMTDVWLCCRRRLARLVARLGVLGTPLLAAVPLLPSHQFPKLHTVAVVVGSLPALLALILFAVGYLSEPHSHAFLRYLTAGFALLFVLCLGLYTQNAVCGGPSLRIVPTLERLTSIGALLWMFALLRQIREPRATQ
jgi:hypothetical protein